jgi:TolB-like protein
VKFKEYLNELQRRHVVKAGVAYLVIAWLIVQVLSILIPAFDLGQSLLKITITILSIGFPIWVIIAWIYDFTPQGIKKTEDMVFDAKGSAKKNVRLNRVIIGALSIALILLIVNQVRMTETLEEQVMKASILPDFTSSIAVLAFKDMSPNKDQEYFSDGISEEILNHLTKYKDLKVISRTSSFAYKGKDITINMIGEELDVAYVLEGSIRKSGDTFRTTVKLIDTKDGTQLWSETFDRKIEDALFTQDEIASLVTKRLKLTLHKKNVRLRKVDPRAYELYLNGRVNLALQTPQSIATAEQYFLKSVEIDPLFAPAFGGLSGIWIVKKQLHMASPEVADPKMEEYLAKAFEIDSADAEVWRWQSSKLANTDFKWTASNNAMEKCLELNPNFSEARAFYAHFLMIQNRWNEAWVQMNRAVELDPFSPLVQNFRGIMLIHQGRYDEYLSVFEPLDISALSSTGLFISYSLSKQYDRAIEHLKRIIKSVGNPEINKLLEETYESAGFSATLNVTAEALSKISDSSHLLSGKIMLLYQLAENREKSLYWLEKLYIRRDPNLPYYAIISPLNEPYQNEPRYIEIMERINLR